MFVAVCVLCGVSMAAFAEDAESQPKISCSGALGWEMGQIVKGRYQNAAYDHIWFGANVASANLQAIVAERLRLQAGIEARIWFNTFPLERMVEYTAGSDRYASFDLKEAQGIYSFFSGKALELEIALGIMPYQYNSSVTDLGEYLFRTGTYPAYIITRFDATSATVSGLRLGARYSHGAFGANADLLVLSEREIRPFHDGTIVAVLGAEIFKVLDVGGGVSFAHCIPVDNRSTTPQLPDASYEISPGDTGFYTFTGTKLMAHATIDPLFFIRGSKFGKLLGQGGKLYGEVAILGLKDYPKTIANPWGYDTLDQKMPLMFGITLPIPVVFDALALEFENYACPYPNDYSQVFQKGWPVPLPGVMATGDYNMSTYRHDDWKWSIYARKQFGRHFELVGQIGRDHQRWEAHIAHMRNYDFEDALVKPDEWAWHLKAQFKY